MWAVQSPRPRASLRLPHKLKQGTRQQMARAEGFLTDAAAAVEGTSVVTRSEWTQERGEAVMFLVNEF